jgi:RNA-binding protein 25
MKEDRRDRDRDKEDEEDAYERWKLERKMREKEVAYQEVNDLLISRS